MNFASCGTGFFLSLFPRFVDVPNLHGALGISPQGSSSIPSPHRWQRNRTCWYRKVSYLRKAVMVAQPVLGDASPSGQQAIIEPEISGPRMQCSSESLLLYQPATGKRTWIGLAMEQFSALWLKSFERNPMHIIDAWNFADSF